jgi:hypothetical protein
MLLTSHIRGHLLSLKFHPQMVTGIQHIQTPISSPTTSKMYHQKAQTIQLVIKSACAQNAKAVRARALVENTGKAHMCPMRDCGRKKPRTPQNGALMILVGLPPTFGSAPKLI